MDKIVKLTDDYKLLIPRPQSSSFDTAIFFNNKKNYLGTQEKNMETNLTLNLVKKEYEKSKIPGYDGKFTFCVHTISFSMPKDIVGKFETLTSNDEDKVIGYHLTKGIIYKWTSHTIKK